MPGCRRVGDAAPMQGCLPSLEPTIAWTHAPSNRTTGRGTLRPSPSRLQGPCRSQESDPSMCIPPCLTRMPQGLQTSIGSGPYVVMRASQGCYHPGDPRSWVWRNQKAHYEAGNFKHSLSCVCPWVLFTSGLAACHVYVEMQSGCLASIFFLSFIYVIPWSPHIDGLSWEISWNSKWFSPICNLTFFLL